MKESRHKKLEWVAQEVVSDVIFSQASELEEEFGIITVTKIKISNDISYLDVYVSCFKNQDMLPKALAEYNHEIQHGFNKRLPLFKFPKIRFRYDTSWEKAGNISNILKSIEKELKKNS